MCCCPWHLQSPMAQGEAIFTPEDVIEQRLTLVEEWRGVVRPLHHGAKIMDLWLAWGSERSDVKFIAKRVTSVKQKIHPDAGGVKRRRRVRQKNLGSEPHPGKPSVDMQIEEMMKVIVAQGQIICDQLQRINSNCQNPEFQIAPNNLGLKQSGGQDGRPNIQQSLDKDQSRASNPVTHDLHRLLAYDRVNTKRFEQRVPSREESKWSEGQDGLQNISQQLDRDLSNPGNVNSDCFSDHNWEWSGQIPLSSSGSKRSDGQDGAEKIKQLLDDDQSRVSNCSQNDLSQLLANDLFPGHLGTEAMANSPKDEKPQHHYPSVQISPMSLGLSDVESHVGQPQNEQKLDNDHHRVPFPTKDDLASHQTETSETSVHSSATSQQKFERDMLLLQTIHNELVKLCQMNDKLAFAEDAVNRLQNAFKPAARQSYRYE